MTTKANILLIAPELSTLSDDVFNLILADVNGSLSSDMFGSQLELAERYLAAHLCTLAKGSGSGAINPDLSANVSESAGRVSITKKMMSDVFQNATRYDTTKYGMLFYNLMRRKPGGTACLVV